MLYTPALELFSASANSQMDTATAVSLTILVLTASLLWFVIIYFYLFFLSTKRQWLQFLRFWRYWLLNPRRRLALLLWVQSLWDAKHGRLHLPPQLPVYYYFPWATHSTINFLIRKEEWKPGEYSCRCGVKHSHSFSDLVRELFLP